MSDAGHGASTAEVVPFPTPDGEDDLVLVPEGTYQATYVGHSVVRAYEGGKLAVRFRITEPGAAFGKILTAWYRVKASRSGGPYTFAVRPLSKFARDWRVLFRRGPLRWSRVPMTALRDMLVSVAVRTVTHDHQQKPLDPVNQYSVIDHLVGRLEP